MKNETRFDPDADLIVVNATIRGPDGSAVVRMAIDTGSAATVIVPDVLDEIGYSARDGTARTSVTTAVGKEHGFLLKVAELEALGFTLSAFTVNVFELANRYGIEGLIGLNFLERFNYEIRRPRDASSSRKSRRRAVASFCHDRPDPPGSGQIRPDRDSS